MEGGWPGALLFSVVSVLRALISLESLYEIHLGTIPDLLHWNLHLNNIAAHSEAGGSSHPLRMKAFFVNNLGLRV